MYNIIKHNLNGLKIDEIVIKKGDLEVSLLNYGATINSIKFKEKEMVLSYSNIEDYILDYMYLGKTVGRFAGRIANGSYSLKGVKYETYKNDNGRVLHGGKDTISDSVIMYDIQENNEYTFVTFTVENSKDNNGFNGTIKLLIKYQINKNGTILVEYKYKNSEYSIMNYTNHSYFNLGKKDGVKGLFIRLNSQYAYKQNNLIIENGQEVLIPQFDGKSVHSLMEYYGDNLDNTFILNDSKAVELINKENGIMLSVSTSYPCCVIYGCTYPNGKELSIGSKMGKFAGLTLECQYAPNEINFAKEKSRCIVEPDRWYTNYIEYKFTSYDE